MKKNILILAVLILGAVACKERIEEAAVLESTNTTTQVATKTKTQGGTFDPSAIALQTGPKIRIATGEAAVLGQDCDGDGKCGPCPAICIEVEWEKKKTTIASNSSGLKEASVTCDGSFF